MVKRWLAGGFERSAPGVMANGVPPFLSEKGVNA
jgi:hypothetical protein